MILCRSTRIYQIGYLTQAFQISAPDSGGPFDADSRGPWSELPLSASDGAH